jgi:hypothetical protein
VSKKINAHALTAAAENIAEALRHAHLAYQFNPGSYTRSTHQACLYAAESFDRYVSELAFAHSAAWLQRFPKIAPVEPSDVE